MLMKEDGHLDIKSIEQLSEAELEKEMDSWGEDQMIEYLEATETYYSLDEALSLVKQEYMKTKDDYIKKYGNQL